MEKTKIEETGRTHEFKDIDPIVKVVPVGAGRSCEIGGIHTKDSGEE